MLHKKSPSELEPLKTLMVVINITVILLKTLRHGMHGDPTPINFGLGLHATISFQR